MNILSGRLEGALECAIAYAALRPEACVRERLLPFPRQVGSAKRAWSASRKLATIQSNAVRRKLTNCQPSMYL